jgi:hypothetical protein
MLSYRGPPLREPVTSKHPLLIVVEGNNDYEFLLRLTDRLQIDAPQIPNLRELLKQQQAAVMLLGGGNPSTWPNRFSSLGLCEFHLYDREQEPETAARIAAIAAVDARPDCRGFLTTKRSLENYLHQQAIIAAGGCEIDMEDHTCVARKLAQAEKRTRGRDWNTISYRTQRRSIAKTKRWLNTVAVEHMTLSLLMERDPSGEVLEWFAVVRQLLSSS